LGNWQRTGAWNTRLKTKKKTKTERQNEPEDSGVNQTTEKN